MSSIPTPHPRHYILQRVLCLLCFLVSASGGSAQTEKGEAKEYHCVGISASVYNHQITELSWSHAGRQYRAYSRLDWTLFAGFGHIETTDRLYSYFLGNSNENIPFTAPNLPYMEGTYSLLSARGDLPPDPEALRVMNDFHAYYLKNKQTLLQKQAEREVARIAREEWLKSHPPSTTRPVNHWGERAVFVYEQ